jgi:hypothetical protein
VRLIPILLALFFTGSAMADDWKDYENRDYGFTIHFPGDPTVEAASYEAVDGRSFPAHVFSVKQDTGVFKVTVVDMPGKQTGSNATVMKEATKVVTAGGIIKFDIDHRVRAIYGRQLGIGGRLVRPLLHRFAVQRDVEPLALDSPRDAQADHGVDDPENYQRGAGVIDDDDADALNLVDHLRGVAFEQAGGAAILADREYAG